MNTANTSTDKGVSASAKPAPTRTQADSLDTAVGLIWGWLDQGQPQLALTLARASLACWPDKAVLHLMPRHCLAELDMPLPPPDARLAAGMPAPWLALLDKLEARQRMRLAASGAPAAPSRDHRSPLNRAI